MEKDLQEKGYISFATYNNRSEKFEEFVKLDALGITFLQDKKELLLKTAFCCMASDGEIAQEEIDTIQQLCEKEDLLKNFDFTTEIRDFVTEINTKGKLFIQEYLSDLERASLSKQENVILLHIAFEMIYADNKVEYSEVKFFKSIRSRLKISDTVIEAHFKEIPDLDIFLEQDIINNFSLEKITTQYLNSVEIPQFKLEDFKL